LGRRKEIERVVIANLNFLQKRFVKIVKLNHKRVHFSNPATHSSSPPTLSYSVGYRGIRLRKLWIGAQSAGSRGTRRLRADGSGSRTRVVSRCRIAAILATSRRSGFENRRHRLRAGTTLRDIAPLTCSTWRSLLACTPLLSHVPPPLARTAHTVHAPPTDLSGPIGTLYYNWFRGFVTGHVYAQCAKSSPIRDYRRETRPSAVVQLEERACLVGDRL
jgi:hypothetical protein